MTKLISVRDEVYELLAGLKHTGESFSELFLRLTREKKGNKLSDLAGILSDWKEADEIFKDVLSRKGVPKREATRL